MKTTKPITTVTEEITVPVKDSFADEVFEAKGTVTFHKYPSGVKMLFCKIKTPFGLGTLKMSFHPGSKWTRDAMQSPTSWLAPQWHKIAEQLGVLMLS